MDRDRLPTRQMRRARAGESRCFIPRGIVLIPAPMVPCPSAGCRSSSYNPQGSKIALKVTWLMRFDNHICHLLGVSNLYQRPRVEPVGTVSSGEPPGIKEKHNGENVWSAEEGSDQKTSFVLTDFRRCWTIHASFHSFQLPELPSWASVSVSRAFQL